MSGMEPCPYGDCPNAPDECRCWEPDSHQGRRYYREPCQACHVWTGFMQECDGSCVGHTDRQWKNHVYGPAGTDAPYSTMEGNPDDHPTA